MDNVYFEDKYKQSFDERLIEMVRGKRVNSYDYLKPFQEIYHMEEPYCVQYNPKQRPVASFGIALYNICLQEWLVVEPKFTIEFLSLVKGAYTLSSLPLIIDQLHDSEIELILKDPDPKRAYYNIHDIVFYTQTIHILYETLWIDNYKYISSIAIKVRDRRASSSETCMQTVFPKGRATGRETWAETAVREFAEETGIDIMFDNPSQSMIRLNSKHPDELCNIWEPCRVNLGKFIRDGYISKNHVTHTHCASGGKMYRTVLWICVISLSREESETYNLAENSETRAAVWLNDDQMRRKFRVQDLYTKCESTLNKYYPYLSF